MARNEFELATRSKAYRFRCVSQNVDGGADLSAWVNAVRSVCVAGVNTKGVDAVLAESKEIDDKDIDAVYAKLLVELAVPESKHGELVVTTTREQKRKLIEANANLIQQNRAKEIKRQVSMADGVAGGEDGDGDGAGEKGMSEYSMSDPRYWIDLLADSRFEGGRKNKTAISVGMIRQLKTVLQTSHRDWLVEFTGAGGMGLLMEALAPLAESAPKQALNPRHQRHASVWSGETTNTTRSGVTSNIIIQSEAIRCLKAVMNNQLGMEAVLQSGSVISQIALHLNPRCRPLTAQVMELLSVVCWYSEDGHEQVVGAMDNYRDLHNETVRFGPLMEAYNKESASSTTSSITFRYQVLLFANSLINNSPSLEVRRRTFI